MCFRLPARALAAGLAAAVLALAPSPGAAQAKRLTLDVLYDPEKKVSFTGTLPTGLAWISDTHYLLPRTDTKTKATELLRVEAVTGRTEPFLDASRMEAALLRLPGVSRDEAASLARQASYTMNAKRTAVVLTIGGDLYHYELGGDRALRLTFAPGDEELPSYSPDGSLVAFVRGGNLYLVDVAAQRERPVTTDGGPERLNGKLDWVYQEEVYGRGYPAYWWSPDSARIAFLQLDEHAVPRYTLVDDLSVPPAVEVYPYPKAGDPNPRARLAVARVSGGKPTFVDLDAYAPVEFLIVNVAWTPDGRQLAYQVQDREQTWLDLNLAEADSGQPKTLLRETSPAWVERRENPVWLEDGSFLWLSERSGFQHVYHHAADGSCCGPSPVGAGKRGRCTEPTTPAGSISQERNTARSEATSTASGSTARARRASPPPPARTGPASARASGATSTAGATSRHPPRCACTVRTAHWNASSTRARSRRWGNTRSRSRSSCRSQRATAP